MIMREKKKVLLDLFELRKSNWSHMATIGPLGSNKKTIELLPPF